MRWIGRSLVVGAAIAALYLAWVFGSRWHANRRLEEAARARQQSRNVPLAEETAGLKIVHFYAMPGLLTEGERAILCYGVVNAVSVRLDPPVEPLRPSRNRCFNVVPEADTRYTLTAQAADGRVASESFVIQVKPDPEKLPKILYFVRGKKQADGPRTLYTLCFETRNAELVTVDPPVLPPSAAVKGCFYVVPAGATTYTLTAADAKGRKAQRRVTVSP